MKVTAGLLIIPAFSILAFSMDAANAGNTSVKTTVPVVKVAPKSTGLKSVQHNGPTTTPTARKTEMLLPIDGVKGESQDKPKSIEIQSFK